MEYVTTKMVELLSGVYVIPGATNVGVITDDKNGIKEVYLIDTGCTELDGDYILETLTEYFKQIESQYKIKAIINTHGHADHIGANRAIVEATGCEIWMPEKEITCAINPLFQTAMMWGAYPPHELRTVFFNAGEMNVDKTFTHGFNISLSNGSTVIALDLGGHSFQNVGILYDNAKNKDILFSGDALFTRDQLTNHWVPFMVNPNKFLESLDFLVDYKDLEWIIPSHGDFIQRNLTETIELNKLAVLSNKKMLLSILKNGQLTTEQIVQEVAKIEEIKLSLAQYGLISSTIKSYLSIMHDSGEIKMKIEDNVLYWYLPKALAN